MSAPDNLRSLAGGKPSLVTERMGSVSVFAEIRPDGKGWVTPADRLGDWLNHYNLYFLTSAGISEGHNLHWLYHREVTVKGEDLYRLPDELKRLNQRITDLSMVMTWLVSLTELMQLTQPAEETIKDLGLGSICLSIAEEERGLVNAQCAKCIEDLCDAGIGLSIIGRTDALQEIGVFGGDPMSKASVTLIQRRLGGDVEELPRIGRTRPCKTRLHFVLDARGLIYPCMGLVHIPSCALGTIDDDLAELVDEREHQAFDLGTLIERGPDLPEVLEEKLPDGVPIDCYAHRRQIIARTCKAGS
ncbi:hypothetical protein [uncultured Roseibium sp.]|uniref:hypothetical protein n=1 Tax=uncultured Roseibium sp. TaxID=1936171 RepID=UPI002619E786|nr:hypothetical protein [uncultured Roseibium sp.]